jgi:hypothetical protein
LTDALNVKEVVRVREVDVLCEADEDRLSVIECVRLREAERVMLQVDDAEALRVPLEVRDVDTVADVDFVRERLVENVCVSVLVRVAVNDGVRVLDAEVDNESLTLCVPLLDLERVLLRVPVNVVESERVLLLVLLAGDNVPE